MAASTIYTCVCQYCERITRINSSVISKLETTQADLRSARIANRELLIQLDDLREKYNFECEQSAVRASMAQAFADGLDQAAKILQEHGKKWSQSQITAVRLALNDIHDLRRSSHGIYLKPCGSHDTNPFTKETNES